VENNTKKNPNKPKKTKHTKKNVVVGQAPRLRGEHGMKDGMEEDELIKERGS
jgi:hypothetical protein